ncbi:tripartite tricarboxylate transporter substrate binding protein [Roseomonas sp. E05]|uniref:Bug family tripartite tricarboxylate transporter substrate binding protein n=1 Tax=Roseomonas sp. E05 TaxID=3046310 RepID=UPI0024BAC951|nr:tripartite tricarboxylate transporter substrate binding protein [Roseomonas sp. E05]MDJ0391066.1 tripartite tricarboxylate transporter substrate binding protein [Roseomonas sp. E05]
MTDRAIAAITRRTALTLAATLGGMTARAELARAADYPTKPIRIVVPYAPGGTTDIATRMVGEQLSQRLGQAVVIENKPGANSIIGAGNVASSPPDGYSLVMVIGAHAANATLYAGKLPFDPVADFAAVSHVVSAPLILAGSTKIAARTLPEFLAEAKARPGDLNYGSSGIGAAAHLTMEDLQARTGARLTHVPYRGTQPALQDLLAGNIAAMFDTYSTLKPQFDAGTIRPLAIASAARTKFAPDLPTFTEGGVPDFVSSTWCMLLAPAKMPAPIIDRIATEVGDMVRQPAISARLEELGFITVGSTPTEASDFLKAEIDRWSRVIHAASVRVE